MCADDTKLKRAVHNKSDSLEFQLDTDKVSCLISDYLNPMLLKLTSLLLGLINSIIGINYNVCNSEIGLTVSFEGHYTVEPEVFIAAMS